MKERIVARLTEGLAPVRLDVFDESAKHAGHVWHDGGAKPGGETHFRVRIVSAAFAGKRSVQRHRMVYDLLAAEIADGVHALALTTETPEERAA